jgi:hypothetical protein
LQDAEGDKQAAQLTQSDRGMVQVPERMPPNITPESPPEERVPLGKVGRLTHDTGTTRQGRPSLANRVVPRICISRPGRQASVRGEVFLGQEK